MNPDRARELLTAELTELDDRARFAADARAEGVDPDSEGALGQHPGDYGSDVASSMDAELLVDTVATQRRHVQDALGPARRRQLRQLHGVRTDHRRRAAGSPSRGADLPRARRHPGRGLRWPHRPRPRRSTPRTGWSGSTRPRPAWAGGGGAAAGRFLDVDGEPITDPAQIARIKALVIPPAWQDVWISPDPDGHIQAIGIDAAGRRQYRYHDDWRTARDVVKYDRVLGLGRGLADVRADGRRSAGAKRACTGTGCSPPGSGCSTSACSGPAARSTPPATTTRTARSASRPCAAST